MKGGNMKVSDEKAFELARDIHDEIRDGAYNAITVEANNAILGQLNSASNETLAAIAWEAFQDGCDGFDVPCSFEAFAARFPVYAELV
jgi:hypothetical protein